MSTLEAQRAFWDWFGHNEPAFRDLDVPDKDERLDALLEALQDHCAGLWFETGRADDGCNELIVSAEGDPRYFSAARLLVAAAPQIDGWRFIAFKPACGFSFTTNYEGIVLDPATAWFIPLHPAGDTSPYAIRVAYAHYDPSRADAFRAGTFIMLECALGEVAFAEAFQHVEVGALPSSPESNGFLPVTELTAFLDHHSAT